ncbi:MAG: PAS domain S-box protein [Gammaproteobacteria bacterium]|nr:PAS domain S-box protein [Gammaproteobacteria bacterium]
MNEPRRYGLRSLRFKLVLASVVVEVFMLTVLVWNSTRITGDAMQAIFQNHIETLVPMMNVSLANPLAQRDYATLDERLRRIVRTQSLVYIEVHDELGKIVASRGVIPAIPHLDPTVETSVGVYDQEFDITLANRSIGRARYGLNVSLLDKTVTDLRNQGLLVASAEIVLTILLLASLGYLLTRRLQALAQSARAIAGGDYAARALVTGRDEVADTALSFNTMAATVERDINERHQAETKLRESEQDLGAIVENLPLMVFAKDAQRLRFVRFNRAGEDLLGIPRADLLGKTDRDFFPPAQAEFFIAKDRETLERGETVDIPEEPIDTPLGRRLLHTRKVVVRDPEGQPRYLLGISEDITERKRAEIWRDGQYRVLAQIVAGKELSAVLSTLVLAMEPQIEGALGSIMLLDADGRHLRYGAGPNLPEALRRAIDGMETGPAAGACGTAVHDRQLVVVEDFQTDPRGVDYRELSARLKLRACWSQPVFSATGQVLGTFAMYYREPRRPTPAEQHLIAETGNLVTVAIESARNRDALVESEARIRRIFEQASDAIFVISADNRFLDVNPSGLEMTGYTREEFLRLGVSDIIVPDERPRLDVEPAEMMAGKPHLAEWLHRRKDGSTFPAEVSARKLNDDSYLAIVRDLTARRRAEEDLKKSEALYHDLVETSQDLIWRCDAEGRFVYLNPAWEQVLGYPVNEMLGKRFSDFQTPEMAARDLQEHARLMQGNTVKGFETVHLSKAGNETHLVFNAKFLADENGKIIGTRGTAYDITERKQLEQARRESEETYRSLFENMLNGFAYCRMLFEQGEPRDFICLSVNKAFETLTGLKDAVGRKISEVIPGIKEADPELFEIYGRVALTGKPERFEIFVESLQAWFWLSVYSPKKEHFVAVFDVITERKQAEERIRAQLDELLRWQNVTLGREGRVQALKDEVNQLLAAHGQPARYTGPESS